MSKIGVRCIEVAVGEEELFTKGKRYECTYVDSNSSGRTIVEFVNDDGLIVTVILYQHGGDVLETWKSKFRFSIMPDVVGGVE